MDPQQSLSTYQIIREAATIWGPLAVACAAEGWAIVALFRAFIRAQDEKSAIGQQAIAAIEKNANALHALTECVRGLQVNK